MADFEPKPIESAPLDRRVLLYWTPKDPNPSAEAWIIGTVSAYEPGKYWDDESYLDLKHITHWMDLPPKITSARPPQQSSQ